MSEVDSAASRLMITLEEMVVKLSGIQPRTSDSTVKSKTYRKAKEAAENAGLAKEFARLGGDDRERGEYQSLLRLPEYRAWIVLESQEKRDRIEVREAHDRAAQDIFYAAATSKLTLWGRKPKIPLVNWDDSLRAISRDDFLSPRRVWPTESNRIFLYEEPPGFLPTHERVHAKPDWVDVRAMRS